MSKPFLQRTAQQILEQFGDRFSDLHIVLPSRRAGMYFRHYLTTSLGTGILSPRILSFEDFVKNISHLEGVDQIDLLLELYQSFKVFDKAQSHTLERFAPLGSAILKDFNLIDHFLEPKKAGELFEYLRDVKALERWADQLGEEEAPTPKKHLSDYFSFWENLRNAYWHFRHKLLQRNQAYNGLAFRMVYENLEALVKEREIFHVCFVGFSQLLRVEEQMIAGLIRMGKATTFWDTDDYYLEAPHQEAGDYFRRYRKSWLPAGALPPLHAIAAQPKEIRIIRVNHAVEQAKVVGDLLARMMEELAQQGQLEDFGKKINHTLIALPDEGMLLPLLHSLPKLENQAFNLAEHVNITMGISFAKTPLFDLVEQIFKLQEGARGMEERKTHFYYLHVLKLLRHPYLFNFEGHRELFLKLEKDVRLNNRVRVSAAYLFQLLGEGPLYRQLFTPWGQEATSATTYFLELVGLFSQQLGEEESLEAELLYRFFTVLKRLESILNGKGGQQAEKISISTYRKLLLEVLRSTQVPFTGKPIRPVQIMGMLESRTLDFEQVIILSCNEGILPTGKVLDSMIPYDLRIQYGLPTHKENDSSFAYTFYRLFHQARKVVLLYTEAASSGQGGKEQSRFLLQLKEEMSLLPGIKVFEETTSLSLPGKFEFQNRVRKDEWVIQKIKTEMQKGVSPSLMNTYIQSPVEFFFKRIFELKEAKEVEEALDYRSFGTLLHKALEDTLAPWTGHVVDWPTIQQNLKDDAWVSHLMEAAGQKELGEGVELNLGKNYLLKKVAERLLRDFVSMECQLPVQLVAQESFLSGSIPYQTPDGDTGIFRAVGKADRIDLIGQQLRIVDYKTGSFTPSELRARNRAELLLNPDKGKIIQLLMYKYITIRSIMAGEVMNLPPHFNLKDFQLVSGFYFFRKLKSGFVGYTLEDEPQTIPAFLAYVEELVQVFVADVFDRSKEAGEAPSDFKPHILPWLNEETS